MAGIERMSARLLNEHATQQRGRGGGHEGEDEIEREGEREIKKKRDGETEIEKEGENARGGDGKERRVRER